MAPGLRTITQVAIQQRYQRMRVCLVEDELPVQLIQGECPNLFALLRSNTGAGAKQQQAELVTDLAYRPRVAMRWPCVCADHVNG